MSAETRSDFDAAIIAIAQIDGALTQSKEPRPKLPISGELALEAAIHDKTVPAEEVLAWASQLSAGDRSALADRLAAVATGLTTKDKDEFTIALANYLASKGIYRELRGILADPRHFDAAAYATARDGREPAGPTAGASNEPTQDAAAAAAAANPASQSLDEQLSRALDGDDVETSLAAAVAALDSVLRLALAQRLDAYRPGFGDAIAARIKRLDRTPALLQILGSLRGDGASASPTTAEQLAAQAIEGDGEPLPHRDTIQQSFGRHDVSSTRAHVGGQAAEASRELGAVAFATQGHVAFASAPDLHTAAHEAAHVVQQRQGVALKSAIDAPGDHYEQHADAVADGVVRGDNVEALLDELAGSASDDAVQRKTGAKPKTASATDEPELLPKGNDEWPVFAKSGKPYLLEDQGGKPGFWAARDWIVAASDMTKVDGAMRAPSRAKELLTAMGWVAATNMDFAAGSLTFKFHGALSHFVVGAEAAWATGMPQGRQAIVDRDAKQGLIVTLSLDDATVPPGRAHAMTTSETQRALQAAAGFTRLAIDPTGQAFLMTNWTPPTLQTGNGVIMVELNRALCQTLFGFDAYMAWSGGKSKPAEEPEAPKLKLENFYKRPIPGQLTHYGDIVEAGEGLRLEVLVEWPHHYPDNNIYDAPPMVTPSKFSNVALLSCSWQFQRLDGADDGPVPKGFTETKSTTLAEAVHNFRLAPGEATGTYRVTCNARFDEYFEPASFSRDVVVMSSSAAMAKLKTEAFASMGAADTDRQHGEWTGNVKSGFKPSPAVGAGGNVDDPMARDRAAQRDRLHDVAEYLRGNPASTDAVEALDREVARQEATEKLLAADRNKGWQPFQIRGTYLSRTEGLASGPLDLHGSVYIELHYDSYAGDGPSTTLRIRNDKVVVQIRDLSRRFEQSDFAFEGRADTFEDALREAFEDLAVAYPKGLVAIEAEQIRTSALRTGDGSAGAEAALGTSTGKVIGHQQSTETTWKKVKSVIWDPVASVVVNLGAIALMTLVPGSALVVAPALIAYNSAPSIDRIKTEADRGTLTLGTFAMSTGEIALNLLPLISRAKPLTAGWFAVETANWGGQVALMGASAVDMAQQLQATQVAALAEEYQQFLELQKTSLPSDPGLAIAERKIRDKAAALDGEITRQFWAQIKGNFFQMAAGSVVHNTSAHARTAIVEHLAGGHAAGASTHAGGDTPVPPPEVMPPNTARVRDGDGSAPPSHDRKPPNPDPTPDANDSSRARDRVPIAEETKLPAHERTTQKDMKAVEPEVDPTTGATSLTFQGRGDRIAALAAKVKPEPGYFDVVVHGDGQTFAVLHDGQWVKIKPNSVRKYLRGKGSYNGQPIRLLSCEAGGHGAITAQAIADGMNVHVIAPTEKIWFSQDKVTGEVELIIGNDPNKPSGGWAPFDPKGADARAPKDMTPPIDESALPPHARKTDRIPVQPDPDADQQAPKQDDHDVSGGADHTVPLGPLPEITPAERTKVHAAVDKQVDRIRDERVQGATAASEEAVRKVAYAAAEKTYRERRRDGQPEPGARKAASDAGKIAADKEWDAQARSLAIDKANQAIDDGSVFERSAMSEDAKAQLDAYRKGTGRDGGAARRQSTALAGKTFAEMQAILDPDVTSGAAARATEQIKGPPPTGAQTQIAYYYQDGSVIRLKPQGDEFNGWQPSYSVEVKTAHAPPGPSDPTMIAFKVDDRGRAVPKDPDQIANPYVDGKYVDQHDAYDQHVLDAGHRLAK
ncbi:MAG: DUF4157 domain-containing protein [Kofleriaceae bacterium]